MHVCSEDCQGTGTIEGLEVCVLGEVKISQEGAFQVAAIHVEQADWARIVAQQVTWANVKMSFQAHNYLYLLAHHRHWHASETWKGTGTSDSSTSGTATYSGAA